MLLNHGMSFHDRLGSMNDCPVPSSASAHPFTTCQTHADRARNALVLLDILPLLHLGAGVVIDELHAHVLLTAAELGRVDGDEQALDAPLLGVLHVLARDLAVAVDVSVCPDPQRVSNACRVIILVRVGTGCLQLEEERLAGCSGVHDVVERARRQRRDLPPQ